MKRTPLKTDPDKRQAFIDRGRRKSAASLTRSRTPKTRRKPISEASPAQRAFVREVGYCEACGAEPSAYVHLTFAHWWPRGRGGCDSALCGGVLCIRPGGMGCHNLQERGELNPDLLKLIVADWDRYRERFQHALEHADPVPLIEKLAGARVEWSDRHPERVT